MSARSLHRITDPVRLSRIPRTVHPVAWWLWAIGLAVASTRTTNPIILLGLVAAVSLVVVARRGDAPWSRSFPLYLLLGLIIVIIRVAFRIVFGGADGPDIIVTLPEIPLPSWAAGIRLFGAVSWQSVLGGLYDGMRLATMIICVGAANSLADPKRLLKSMPNALQDLGTVLVVAVSVFPQLAESVLRVRRARRLRGGPQKGRHAVRAIIVPVLSDALDRSLILAAAMEGRGYGRHGRDTGAWTRRLSLGLNLAGISLVAVGVYNTLDTTTPRILARPPLLLGVALCLVALAVSGRALRTTRYRPDPITPAAVVTGVTGFIVAWTLTSDLLPGNLAERGLLYPVLEPLSMPSIGTWHLVAIALAAAPAFLTPPPPSSVADPEPIDSRRTPDLEGAS